jgi:hypothetical protein
LRSAFRMFVSVLNHSAYEMQSLLAVGLILRFTAGMIRTFKRGEQVVRVTDAPREAIFRFPPKSHRSTCKGGRRPPFDPPVVAASAAMWNPDAVPHLRQAGCV